MCHLTLASFTALSLSNTFHPVLLFRQSFHPGDDKGFRIADKAF